MGSDYMDSPLLNVRDFEYCLTMMSKMMALKPYLSYPHPLMVVDLVHSLNYFQWNFVVGDFAVACRVRSEIFRFDFLAMIDIGCVQGSMRSRHLSDQKMLHQAGLHFLQHSATHFLEEQ